ncbi:hypothetical protein AA313_de0202632 [Arthrobotrys entomopaga]|nr:hypothetical protein AA313_de0202632 [Arthrobotrys entomopaga]
MRTISPYIYFLIKLGFNFEMTCGSVYIYIVVERRLTIGNTEKESSSHRYCYARLSGETCSKDVYATLSIVPNVCERSCHVDGVRLAWRRRQAAIGRFGWEQSARSTDENENPQDWLHEPVSARDPSLATAHCLNLPCRREAKKASAVTSHLQANCRNRTSIPVSRPSANRLCDNHLKN